jgi:hypothetical protein
MIDKNVTINAVSPFKKRSKSYKGGTKIKSKATRTLKQHGGFGKSTATHNKPGYTANTRFRIPDKKTFPSSGSSAPPAPTKPYSFGKDGGIVFNPIINVAGSTVNNNPSFVNKNANANAGGTGKSETTTTTESGGHWEHHKEKRVYKDEEKACNEARRKKHFANDQAGFDAECTKYKKHVEEKGHGANPQYTSSKKWVSDGTKSTTTTKNTNSGGGNATAIIY